MTHKRKYIFHSEQSGAAISIKVVPQAKASHISEILSNGCVVICLACDSDDESCHPTLLKFLANSFKIDITRFEIVAGEKSDTKIVSIIGMDSQKVENLLKKMVKSKAK